MSESDRVVVRMQTRGRVTVPAAFRRRLGWEDGSEIALEGTARGVLIAPLLASAPLDTVPTEERRGGEDLLLRDLTPGVATTSPGILNMIRLGDALRARLRQPIPAGFSE